MNEKPPQEKEVIIDKEYVRQFVEATKAEIAPMGGNNYEWEKLNKVLADLENGECSPEEAIERVRQVQKYKESGDYH